MLHEYFMDEAWIVHEKCMKNISVFQESGTKNKNEEER